MGAPIPHYSDLLAAHHIVMMEADVDNVMRLREEAHNLVLKLNGGEPGIIADEDGLSCVLSRKVTAKPGTEPFWGRTGEFEIAIRDMKVWIAFRGRIGVGARYC